MVGVASRTVGWGMLSPPRTMESGIGEALAAVSNVTGLSRSASLGRNPFHAKKYQKSLAPSATVRVSREVSRIDEYDIIAASRRDRASGSKCWKVIPPL